jgi:hypothetical protein
MISRMINRGDAFAYVKGTDNKERTSIPLLHLIAGVVRLVLILNNTAIATKSII